MSAVPELDEATRERLKWEAARLAAEQGMDLKAARRIVWADYLDELAAGVVMVTAQPVPAPEAVAITEPEETPVPEPPPLPAGRHPVQAFWQASQEAKFTPEWLAANKARLAQVKRLVGLRSK